MKKKPTSETPTNRSRYSNRFIVQAHEIALVVFFGSVIVFLRRLPEADQPAAYGILLALVVAIIGGMVLAYRRAQPQLFSESDADITRKQASLTWKLTAEQMVAHYRAEKRRRADHASLPFDRNWSLVTGTGITIAACFIVLILLYLGSGRAANGATLGRLLLDVALAFCLYTAFLASLFLVLTSPALVLAYGFPHLGLLGGEPPASAQKVSLVLDPDAVGSGILWEDEGGASHWEGFPLRISRIRLHPPEVPGEVSQMELVSEGNSAPTAQRHYLPIPPGKEPEAEALAKQFATGTIKKTPSSPS